MKNKLLLFTISILLVICSGCNITEKKNIQDSKSWENSVSDSSNFIKEESLRAESSADSQETKSFITCNTDLALNEIKDAKISTNKAEELTCDIYTTYINKDSNTNRNAHFLAEGAAKFDNDYYYFIRAYELNSDVRATIGWYFVNVQTGEVYDAGPVQSELIIIPKKQWFGFYSILVDYF